MYKKKSDDLFDLVLYDGRRRDGKCNTDGQGDASAREFTGASVWNGDGAEGTVGEGVLDV